MDQLIKLSNRTHAKNFLQVGKSSETFFYNSLAHQDSVEGINYNFHNFW